MSFSDIVDYRIINPYQILDSFELIAKGEMPAEFQKISNDYNVKCWQLLEEGVYYFFNHIMMHETIKQGKESLFENEPDGIVLLDAYISEYAFIYECKQRKTSYNLSSDDIKRYKDYIKVKKHVISIKYHKILSHFIIIAPEFNGEFESKINKISIEGVTVTLITAKQFRDLFYIFYSLELRYRKLIRLDQIFTCGIFDITKIKPNLQYIGDRETRLAIKIAVNKILQNK